MRGGGGRGRRRGSQASLARSHLTSKDSLLACPPTPPPPSQPALGSNGLVRQACGRRGQGTLDSSSQVSTTWALRPNENSAHPSLNEVRPLNVSVCLRVRLYDFRPVSVRVDSLQSFPVYGSREGGRVRVSVRVHGRANAIPMGRRDGGVSLALHCNALLSFISHCSGLGVVCRGLSMPLGPPSPLFT